MAQITSHDVMLRQLKPITTGGVHRSAISATLRLMVKKVSPEASEVARQAGLRLRAAVTALGLTITQVARDIGVQQNTLSNWLSSNNKRMPDQVAMLRLWQHHRIPMEFIYGGDIARTEYDLAQKLIEACAEVGAVVGAPVAEFPMQTDHLGRAPARVPHRSRGTLHEPPPPTQPLRRA